jgi:GntR family transcriptional regulator
LRIVAQTLSMTETPFPGVPLATPLYREVKRQLMEALAGGEWKPGDAIPAERRLAERFGISIGTVRRAIDELVAENILIRQQGRGTFVASHNRDRLLFYFFHVVPQDGAKEYPVVRLLGFARAKADKLAGDALEIAVGDPIFRIRNLLSLSGEPVIVDDITVSAARFPGMNERAIRDRPSTVYNLYQDMFGISVVRTVERLRATTVDDEIAPLLRVAAGAPLLEIRRVALTYSDVPVEWRVSHVNTARHEYWSELRNP